jgi:plasmid stabilization system protein ParE
VARLIYSPVALHDLERLFEFLAERDPQAAVDAMQVIRSAVDILGVHPLVGRVRDGEVRELVISFGASGYLALYRYLAVPGIVRVLGFRHQRELDYPV